MYFPKIAGSLPFKLFAPSHGDFFIDAVEILQRSEFAFSKIQFCCLRVILFINSKLQRWGSIFPEYQGRECLISIAYTPVPRAIMLKAKVERCSGLLRAPALRCTLTNKQKQTQRNLTHYHEIHRSNILEIAVTACWHQGRLKNSGFFGNFPHVGEPRSTAWEIQSQ